ncbi:MAG TPA: ABC transporter substrate-binding protein [Alphaproteobacteria bacterium]|nr:ABC transporter substrate-binding protein [Alphaproteobacteria bacterium]
MSKAVRLAVPDLVSNSYFPAIAAVELGCFREEGLTPKLELIFPNFKAFEALRAGKIDVVAAPAHVALRVFPEGHGLKLLAALAQGMFWVLVMRAKLHAKPGDVNAVRGRTIGAAPMVDLGLKHLLAEAGIDPERDVRIVGVEGMMEPGVSFGVAAAKALADGQVDGFWANAMGAENAVRSGVGKVILDVRRGLGPAAAAHYTFSALATSDKAIERHPDIIDRSVRAVVKAQRLLKGIPRLATEVGRKLFPAAEADVIADIIKRDAGFYDAAISQDAIDGLNRFAIAMGLLKKPMAYENVVATQFQGLWRG